MRIAHFVDRPDAIGGVPTYLEGLLPALAARGHDNVVVTAAPLATFAGAPCIRVEAVGASGPSLSRAEQAAIGAALEGVDVVYAHIARSPAVVHAAADAAPVVFFAHDYYSVCPGSMRYLHRSERLCVEGPGLRCFTRAYTERSTNRRPDRLLRDYRRVRAWDGVWPRLARVVAASPFVADLLAGDGVPAASLRVVPYFVDPSTAAAVDRRHDVLYVGRLLAAKGVHVLVRALASLDGVTAAIAGDGPDRAAVERLVRELGLEDRVSLLGWVPAAERAALLSASAVFVLPSLWDEPFGIAGLEALAAGVPVVGTRVGGIPSWLVDGDGGTLVARGDSAGLAEALRQLLDDDALRAEQSRRARDAAARFSVVRHLDLLVPELEAAAAGA